MWSLKINLEKCAPVDQQMLVMLNLHRASLRSSPGCMWLFIPNVGEIEFAKSILFPWMMWISETKGGKVNDRQLTWRGATLVARFHRELRRSEMYSPPAPAPDEAINTPQKKANLGGLTGAATQPPGLTPHTWQSQSLQHAHRIFQDQYNGLIGGGFPIEANALANRFVQDMKQTYGNAFNGVPPP
jgi:hypothetical protein